MVLRIIWFLLVLVTAAGGPLPLLLVVGLPYLFYYAGIELLAIAVIVDGYYGFERTEWPLYTLTTLALVFLVRFLRPYISVYNR